MYVGTRRSDNVKTNCDNNIAAFITCASPYLPCPDTDTNGGDQSQLGDFVIDDIYTGIRQINGEDESLAKNHNYVADDHNQSYW